MNVKVGYVDIYGYFVGFGVCVKKLFVNGCVVFGIFLVEYRWYVGFLG